MLGWALAALTVVTCNATQTAVVAHRGGLDSGFPENTLPAFRHAVAAGAHVIELDVRATRDGQVVVLHDPRVDRTTNGRGLVHHLTGPALRRLDAGNGVRVPTLRDVLLDADIRDVELLLDIKRAPRLDLAAIVAQAAEHDRLHRILFGVRSLGDRARLAKIRPDLRFLAFVSRPDQIDAFLESGVEVVRLWPHWVERTPTLVDDVHRAGARVWITAGGASLEELGALLSFGVDGFLTDRPAAAAAGFGCG